MSAQVLGGENGIRKGNSQISFPAVFEAVASTHGLQSQYLPVGKMRPFEVPVGTDLQAQWHDQKKKDADFMASQKVYSTRVSDTRAGVSAHGYFGMPRVVLGQRQFANPSLGAGGNHSARQDQEGPFQLREAGVLSGGVLRSKQGQEYRKKALLSRITQLNAIDANKQNFMTGLPAPALSTMDRAASTQRASDGDPTSTAVGETIKVELNQLLRGIDDAMEGEEGRISLSRFTYTDATRMLSLIFRIAPSATEDELQGLLGDIENTLQDLTSITDADNTTLKVQDRQIAVSLGELYTNVREYLVGMIRTVNLSPKERVDVSKSLVKSIGFSKLGQATPRNVQFAQAGVDARDDDNFDDEEESEQPSREDTEHGTTTASAPPDDDDDDEEGDVGVGRLPVSAPRVGLTRDERDTFGYSSGAYYPQGGRQQATYFGEEGGGENVGGPGFEAVATTGQPQREFQAPAPVERRVAEAPAVQAAQASALSGLRRVYDRDTQGFTVATSNEARSPAARRPSSRVSEASARVAAAPETALPTTAAELRDQTRTMDDVRALVARMNASGVPHRVRASTAAPDIARKNIAKKLRISGRF